MASFQDVFDKGCVEPCVADWSATRGALYFSTRVYACDLAEIDADLWAFDRRWHAIDPADPPAPFKTPTQFRVWRELITSALEAFHCRFAPSTVAREEKKDSWERLRDMAIKNGHTPLELAPLAAVRRVARSEELDTFDVNHTWACQVQDRLYGHTRWYFRQGIRFLDRLHEDVTFSMSGLLPDTIGALPKAPSPSERMPVPSHLADAFEAWLEALRDGESVGFRGRRLPRREESTLRTARKAMAWFARACHSSGVLEPHDDPDPGFFACQHILDRSYAHACKSRDLWLGARAENDYWRTLLTFLRRFSPALEDPR